MPSQYNRHSDFRAACSLTHTGNAVRLLAPSKVTSHVSAGTPSPVSRSSALYPIVFHSARCRGRHCTSNTALVAVAGSVCPEVVRKLGLRVSPLSTTGSVEMCEPYLCGSHRSQKKSGPALVWKLASRDVCMFRQSAHSPESIHCCMWTLASSDVIPEKASAQAVLSCLHSALRSCGGSVASTSSCFELTCQVPWQTTYYILEQSVACGVHTWRSLVSG